MYQDDPVHPFDLEVEQETDDYMDFTHAGCSNGECGEC